MKKVFVLGMALSMGASMAFAGEVKPSDVVYEDGAVNASVSGKAGDPVAGRKAFINRKQGNCLACHANAEIPEQSFHGEVGPSLDGVADRWSEAELRGLVSNPKQMFEGTIMPAFYIDSGYDRPLEKFAGKSVLTAQQVEDIVAYLMTLKEE